MKYLLVFIIVSIVSFSTMLSQNLKDIEAGIIQVKYGAVAWGDIDNDGDVDLFICGEDASMTHVTKLYENTGDNVFVEIADFPVPGLSIGAAEWGDFNNDDYIDLLVQGFDGTSGFMKIYENNGDNTFTVLAQNFPPVYMGAVSWVDFNNDDNLDFSINGYRDADPWDYVSLIYKNNGDETFTELTGLNLTGTMYGKFKWADYDNDDYMDFILTGFADDFYTKIFRNNGDETFIESEISLYQCWLGDVEWGDFDGDNNIDLVISGTGGDGTERVTIIYKNNGDGTYSQTADVLPGVSHSSLEWADFDFDGDLDLYISGTPETPGGTNNISSIYLNNDNSFELGVSFAPNYWGESRVCDYNNDNYPDIVVSGVDDAGEIFSAIYQNVAPVSIKNLQNNDFTISPIPADNQVNVQGIDIVKQITVIDVSGKEIEVIYPNTKSFIINTENYVSGIYYINLRTEKETISKKIIIRH